MMAADSIGVTARDTGEFLLGTVTVTPVFLESNGQIDPQSENWTTREIDEALAKVSEGVNWWSDTLDSLSTVHSLEFVIDDTFARTPFETPYEPINRNTSAIDLYIGDFVTRLGYGDSNSIEDAVQRFNHDQRIKHNTDWAFTIFVADSSDDADGLFSSGGSFAAAFAYAGGLFLVTPSTRPASTITHELGHIFWAEDEYQGGGSYTDRRGYYNTQNLNAADNPARGFVQAISIMRSGVPLTTAFNAHTSPASTLAMVGWQDSDGDGIFDLADVPLELSGIGYFDVANSMYHFRGQASAVPLINQNSSGTQSDITLGRVSKLQYRLDDTSWLTALSTNSQIADLDFSLPITEPFTKIDFRVIDVATGIVSPTIHGTNSVAAISQAGVVGIAFVDENGDGLKDFTEPTLASTTVLVRHADGSPLLVGNAKASSFSDGVIDEAELTGVSLMADGLVSGDEVGAFELEGVTGARAFSSYDQQRSRWVQRWSSKVALKASFDEPVGEVTVSLVGLDDASYGRIEAYDANGLLITRQTTGLIAAGATAELRLTDPRGSIASVRVFGHAGSGVAITGVDFGSDATMVTDISGAVQLANLADGDYSIAFVPERLIHDFGSSSQIISVVGGASPFVQAAATRIDSPRHNLVLAEDADRDGGVTARDALVIINDLTRNQSRMLSAGETAGFSVDVNNDGAVSALDALLVINELSRQSSGNGEQVASLTAVDQVMSDWSGQDQFSQKGAGSSSQPVNTAITGLIAQPERLSKTLRMLNFDGGNAVDESVAGMATDITAGGVRNESGIATDAFEGIRSNLSEPLGDSAV